MSTLAQKIADLAAKYHGLACEWLSEAIRIPADEIKENPKAGQSAGEGKRLEYLKSEIIKHKCVMKPEDVWIDEAGNLEWVAEDPDDKTPRELKKVIYFDGHTDTVAPLPEGWKKIGGVDCWNGLLDASKINRDELKKNLGWVPKESEYENCIWGRGSADQLAGVISQMVATKVCIELRAEGALKGVIIRSVGTVSEEDNDGQGPRYYLHKVLKGKMPEMIPDVVVITEGTGDSKRSALGIYRAQRGRMQIEVEIIGASCHGSMPYMGKNPLEWGARVIVEATEQVKRGEGILDHEFLGKGTRTASWAVLNTPSDCAVPERFVFRFDRRMTVGETPEQCLKDIENLPAVEAARKDGLRVYVRAPKYEGKSWTGYVPGNDQIYHGWETPADHPAVKASVDAYTETVGKNLDAKDIESTDGYIKADPFVGRWIFSTDGVGVPFPEEDKTFELPEYKNWVHVNGIKYPAMVGLGAGSEQNTHRIGECIHKAELKYACMWLSRFPSRYAEITANKQ